MLINLTAVSKHFAFVQKEAPSDLLSLRIESIRQGSALGTSPGPAGHMR